MVGCIGLIVLALCILLLGLWARSQRKGVGEFYKKYSLVSADDPPQNVREAIGVTNLFCLKGTIKTKSGDDVPFYWWEWASTSMQVNGPTVQSSIACFLAISFAPNTVSKEFVDSAIAEKEAKRSIFKIVKDLFALNTRKPIRTETLADGSFVVFWQIVQRPAVMEEKIAWLTKNLKAWGSRPRPVIAEYVPMTESLVNVTPEPEPNARAVIRKHDDYGSIQRAFTAAWPNLVLELDRSGHKLWKEGRDEFEPSDTFFDLTEANDIVVSLEDRTIASTAAKAVSAALRCEAFILRDGLSVEDEETLAYCNEPFMLPLDRYTYGEFKRRFREQWPNLSIELYDVSPGAGRLMRGKDEIADNVEMSTLNTAALPLHDHIYISEWEVSLSNGSISAAIRNERLGTYCEGDTRYRRLRSFNTMADG